MKRIDGRWRDMLVAIGVVGGVLFVLWLYTGNWPPPVVVESNSMMHVDPGEYQGNFGDTRAAGVPFGRFGTIDPGDLVLVKKVDAADDVDTFALGRDEHYGDRGDVIVYYPYGDRSRTPIIHRAMTYVEVVGAGSSRQFEVQWTEQWDEPDGVRCSREPIYTCTFGSGGITIESLFIDRRAYQHSGFITRGDNAATNQQPDQVSGLVSEPVRLEWVQGVARGELPWFGVIKLMITGIPKNAEVSGHPYYPTFMNMTAPRDVWIMLVVGVAIVALAPLAFDLGVRQLKARRARGDEPLRADHEEVGGDTPAPEGPAVSGAPQDPGDSP